MFDQEAIDAHNEKLREEAERQEELRAAKEVADNVDSVKKAIEFQTARLISDKKVNPQNVRVLNNLASPDDIKQVVQGLDKLAVVLKPEANDDGPVIDAINSLRDQLIKLPSEMPEVETVEEVTVKNLDDFKSYIKPLLDAINSLELSPTFDPKIEVKPADVKITTEKLDTSDLLQSIDTLSVEFGKLAKKEQPAVDLTKVIEATKATTKAINNLSFPVPNYVLPFSKDGKATQVTLNSDGSLPTSTTLTTTSYKTEVDKSTTTNVIYIGKAPIGTALGSGAWQIKKVDKTVTDNVTITFAAAGAFTATWNNRGSETYS
mgnify:CR=1 FL=1